MSRACIAGGLLCELVQTGISMSWQLDFHMWHAGAWVGLVGVLPAVNRLGELLFDRLTAGNGAAWI